MKNYSISQLAGCFGLSRSTLLYYDRIGLLSASDRTAAGYRRYSERDYQRLERICLFRKAGLALADVQHLLADEPGPSRTILEQRLSELEQEIVALRTQQHVIAALLKTMTQEVVAPTIDKQAWVAMLAAAGLDEAGMKAWHAEYEKRSPSAHHDFLRSLGIDEAEACRIQQWCLMR